MTALLFLLACSMAPSVPAVEGVSLQRGPHQGELADPTLWEVELRAGERLFVEALSDTADLVLTVQSPDGSTVRRRSRRDQHRAASVWLRASSPGPYRIRVSGQSVSAGAYTILRAQPLSGSLCEQLSSLTAGDPWKLPGVEHQSDGTARRTRSLLSVMSWADSCTVNRLGDMDVGPSCSRSALSEEEARTVFESVESEFLDCHGGWMLSDESEGTTREWVAENEGALHFLRGRDDGERGWTVSTGAMPL